METVLNDVFWLNFVFWSNLSDHSELGSQQSRQEQGNKSRNRSTTKVFLKKSFIFEQLRHETFLIAKAITKPVLASVYMSLSLKRTDIVMKSKVGLVSNFQWSNSSSSPCLTVNKGWGEKKYTRPVFTCFHQFNLHKTLHMT